MEQLFSTIAQISFTLVGLFFVALTVDAGSRKFWFGNKTRSLYAYINFFFMLLPGFVAIGGLMASPWVVLPVWPLINTFLLVIYFAFYIELLKMKKTRDYKLISLYEDKLDITATASFDLIFLFVLAILGVYSYLMNPGARNFTNFFLSLSLFGFVIFSVVSVNIFLRVYAQNKNERRMSNKAKHKIKATNVRPSTGLPGRKKSKK